MDLLYLYVCFLVININYLHDLDFIEILIRYYIFGLYQLQDFYFLVIQHVL